MDCARTDVAVTGQTTADAGVFVAAVAAGAGVVVAALWHGIAAGLARMNQSPVQQSLHPSDVDLRA